MEAKYLDILRDPEDLSKLTFYDFHVEGSNIIDGLLVNETLKNAYPILSGVPIMLAAGFTDAFCEKYSDQLSEINRKCDNKLAFKVDKSNWSFSNEWGSFFEDDMSLTWDWTVQDRYEQFFLETDTHPSELSDKIVMDAGCGNAMLSEEISKSAKMVIGYDLSESVMAAEHHRKSKSLLLVRGDLQKLPFADEVIDILVSNGVIHHSPNTKKTFDSIARVVKEQGKLYIWLYSEKGNLPWRIKRKFFDVTRAVVSRLPSGAQDVMVELFTTIFHAKDKNRDRREVKIAMYDSITPKWRHYHTPEEVAHWYYEHGFGPITLSHFDNKYGFGVCATKDAKSDTPGDHFGNKSQSKR